MIMPTRPHKRTTPDRLAMAYWTMKRTGLKLYDPRTAAMLNQWYSDAAPYRHLGWDYDSLFELHEMGGEAEFEYDGIIGTGERRPKPRTISQMHHFGGVMLRRWLESEAVAMRPNPERITLHRMYSGNLADGETYESVREEAYRQSALQA
jgi:hypothetical protein